MGEEYVEREFGVPAGNAKRDGARLFELVRDRLGAAAEARARSLSPA
jgi:hypothetical protein